MSHAEAITLHPAAGATDTIVRFASGLRHGDLSDEVRYYARRHLLDTIGVMIAGAPGDVATNAERMLASVRSGAGQVPVPGRATRHDLLDAAFLGGTAAHGIELDDGYRVGSAHCGCTVVPAALSVGYQLGASGAAIIEAVVAGYEVAICLARACAPDLRQRGFHPTSVVGPLGAAVAVGKLRRLTAPQIADALGIAASASAGLFAFVNGGADIKRLHAGHASREGIQAALLAELGVQGPPNVVEARDGFMQAFAFGRSDKARPITLPPDAPFGITDCYIKPYACCRHIQPAVEALYGLLNDENIAADDIRHVDVETYRIAAEHAHTGWDDYASAQLSFPYLMGVAARFRGIKVHHFNEETRRDPAFGEFAKRLTITAPPEIDGLYPKLRPARVTVTTPKGKFVRQADEALGSRIVPLDDVGLEAKFIELVEPVLTTARARELATQLWDIETVKDIRPLVDATAL
ncbi:MAG TPA: MmgE/PrpD family protein [Xanthobacteraceae bacterium]|nr:MmgE/PrpD family protein [Xanthobacteraceae bacterium]